MKKINNDCEHEIETKVENGYIITYCTKCGEIFDSKPVPSEREVHWNEGLVHDNGGQILHDYYKLFNQIS